MKIHIIMTRDQFGTEFGECTEYSNHRYDCKEVDNSFAPPADTIDEAHAVIDIAVDDPSLKHALVTYLKRYLNQKCLYQDQDEVSLLSAATHTLHAIMLNRARIRGALMGMFIPKGLVADTINSIASHLRDPDEASLVRLSHPVRDSAKKAQI